MMKKQANNRENGDREAMKKKDGEIWGGADKERGGRKMQLEEGERT